MVTICLSVPGLAGETETSTELLDIRQMSLEDLANIPVTSVSKHAEPGFDAAAAVFVITSEDIRRSGATVVPEVLRMVPGLQVARITANSWAVSIRGFNGRYANKLLVMIDGRTVYTPLYSGVYWDVQDVLLEDVDRIEVIRGPGGTMWGANAVNGVINIITKSSSATTGGLVTIGAGTHERPVTGVRYGDRVGESFSYRVWAKYFDREGFSMPDGSDAFDGWSALRAGIRADWKPNHRDEFTFDAVVYDGTSDWRLNTVSLQPPYWFVEDVGVAVAGGHFLARWQHTRSERSQIALQLYYDRTERDNATMDEVRDTFDLEFQHSLQIGSRHDLLWGFGGRLTRDRVIGSLSATIDPERRDLENYSIFLQDEISLIDDRLDLVLGWKAEHNGYTGLEHQPQARLLWAVGDRSRLWFSVSRAVRTPSRLERDFRGNAVAPPAPGGPLTLISFFGNPGLESETLIAYEMGFRARPSSRWTIDVTAYQNHYSDLRSFVSAAPFFEPVPPPPHLVLPIFMVNAGEGRAIGGEIAATWEPHPRLRLSGAYTLLDMEMERDSSPDPDFANIEGEVPKHQLFVRSLFTLPKDIELDVAVMWVDELPAIDVPSYTRVDLRLGWRPTESLELSVAGQNLTDHRHVEFGSGGFGFFRSNIDRSVYGAVTWRF